MASNLKVSTRDTVDAKIVLTAEQKELLDAHKYKHVGQKLAIPTDDPSVMAMLRHLKQPVTMYSEGPYERRTRLKDFLARNGTTALGELGHEDQAMDEDSDVADDEEFFTRGSLELEDARIKIMLYSMGRAKRRLAHQRLEQAVSLTQAKAAKKATYSKLQHFELYATQTASYRPLSTIAIHPLAQSVLTGDFSGCIEMWSIPNAGSISRFIGHTERVGGIAWHPHAYSFDNDYQGPQFSSGGGDGAVFLWSPYQPTPLVSLEGHALRVACTAWHPSGLYLGTASYDMSWRLWDIETSTEILLQEGHSREVHTISFQNDGALAASGGLDGIGRVWDLRTGRSVMIMEGHVGPVTSAEFLPSSYHVSTTSADNSLRIHDVRNLKSSVKIVPAHNNVVSRARFNHTFERPTTTYANNVNMEEDDNKTMKVEVDALPSRYEQWRRQAETLDSLSPSQSSHYGDFAVTCSFDKTAKVWGVGDWKQLACLGGHENKIMDVDVSWDGQWIATASFDRTFKLWRME